MKRWLLFALFLCAVWPASTEAAKPKNLSFSCALATGGTTCLGDYPIAGGDNDGFSGVSALADTDAARVLAVVAGVPKVCDYVFDADDATTATDSSDTTGCPAAVRGYDASWSAGVWILASYTVKTLTIPKVSGTAGASCVYDGNSTDTDQTCWEGAANRSGNLTLKHSNSDPAANQFMLFPAPTTGSATYAWQTYGTFTGLTLILPSSDADPGTTAGNLRHDNSDTDASAGGILEWYDGTNTRRVVDGAASAAANYTVIVKTEFVPVAWMVDGAAAPDAIATYGSLKYRDFAADATKDLKFIWLAPWDMIGTTVKVRPIVMVTASTAPADTEGVSWGISAASSGTSDSVDPSRGTVVYSEDADLDNDCNAQYDQCVFPFIEVTPTDLAAGEIVAFTINRKHDDADDDYGQKIGLIGVEIKYKSRINLVDTW